MLLALPVCLESTSGALADYTAAIKRDPSYADTARMRVKAEG
jgi:hypothetical protein